MFSEVVGDSGVQQIFSTLGTPLRFLLIAVCLVFAIMFAVKAVLNYLQMLSKESAQEKQTYREAAKNNLIGLAVSVVAFLVIQILLRIFGVTGLF